MNLVVLACLAMSSFGFTNASPGHVETDLQLQGFRGRVRSVFTESVKVESPAKQPSLAKEPESREGFDLNGRITFSTDFGRPCPECAIVEYSTTSYRYDGVNRRTGTITSGKGPRGHSGPSLKPEDVDKDGNLLVVTSIKFDTHLRRIEETVARPSGLHLSTVIYERNARGQITKRTRVHPDSGYESARTFTYNKKGHPDTEVTSEGFKGQAPTIYNARYAYKYDKTGNWIERDSWHWLGDSRQPADASHYVTVRSITYY